MKKLGLTLVCLGLLSGLMAQNKCKSPKIEHGDILKISTQPIFPLSAKSILKVFHFDNNAIESGIGLGAEAYTLGAYIELNEATLLGYANQTIDYVKFGIDNKNILSKVWVKVYENSLNGNPVVADTLPVSQITKGWNLFELPNGYTIKTNTPIFIGVEVATNKGGYTLTYDTDAAASAEFGGHLTLNGAYYGTLLNKTGIDADMNIQAYITDGLGTTINDLAITYIYPANPECQLGTDETLVVKLLNKGEAAIETKFNLTVQINGKSVSQQVSPTAFVPNSEFLAEISAFDMSVLGVYDAVATVEFADFNPENNQMSQRLYSGDARFRMELYTDASADENRWQLADKQGNIIAQSENLLPETEYINEICIESQQCYTWTLFDAYGDGLVSNDTLFGTFKLFYNDSLIATSPENGSEWFEFSKFGIGEGCARRNIRLTDMDLPRYEVPGSYTIGGSVYNNGTDTLTYFETRYSINGAMSEVQAFTDIEIPMGSSYTFTHSVPYPFDNEQTYQVTLEASMPNGQADEYTDDNTMTQKLVINSGVVSKTQLIEQFTSSTNDACFEFNQLVNESLAPYTDYSLIRYQANWPGNGDPYYIEATGERMAYYGATELPSVYRNGHYNMNIDEATYTQYASEKTIAELDGFATFTGNMVNLEAQLKAIANIDSGYRLFVAMVELYTTGNIGTNGETEFNNVIMSLYPDSKGFALDKISDNETITFSENINMQSTYVEEMSDLLAVIFVQHPATGEVLQSLTIPVVTWDNVLNKQNTNISIYPNPFQRYIELDNLEINSTITIFNLLGQRVLSTKSLSKNVMMDAENLERGLYTISIVNSHGDRMSYKVVKN